MRERARRNIGPVHFGARSELILSFFPLPAFHTEGTSSPLMWLRSFHNPSANHLFVSVTPAPPTPPDYDRFKLFFWDLTNSKNMAVMGAIIYLSATLHQREGHSLLLTSSQTSGITRVCLCVCVSGAGSLGAVSGTDGRGLTRRCRCDRQELGKGHRG